MSRVWSSRWRPWGLAAAFLLAASTAHAACSSPTANEGSLNYNYTSHVFQYCDDTSTWQSLVAGGGGGYADHIISGTTAVWANSATSTISFTTNGNLRLELKAANDNYTALKLSTDQRQRNSLACCRSK